MWKTEIVFNERERRENEKSYRALYANGEAIIDQRSLASWSELCIFCPKRKYVKLLRCPIRSDCDFAKDSFRKGHSARLSLLHSQLSIEFRITVLVDHDQSESTTENSE